jgi:hypothetical protein
MRIDSSGNVGIGTSSPVALGAGYGTLTINGSTQGDIQLQANGTSNGFMYGNASDSGAGTLTNTPFKLFTNSTEQMRIDSSGNLLVGTTTVQSAKIVALTTGNASISCAQTGTSGDQIYFRTSTSTLAGYITCPTATTTSYVSLSDYRLKENTTPMTGALAKISALKPCTYTWKADGSAGQGFIAHELQAVVPDCVVGEKDAVDEEGNPKHQGIDTSFLVATLTAAIQELKAIIDTQAARITALEAKA